MFPTGYAANTGLLAVLGGAGCAHLFRRAQPRVVDRRVPHGPRARRGDPCLRRTATSTRSTVHWCGAERGVVVTDTVFSMDGDIAPVDALAAICRKHGAILVLDDAHKVFPVAGSRRRRSAPMWSSESGTLSKALGALGGFVAGRRALIDLLINRARPFIFTTAPTPADTAAALAALDVVSSPQGRGAARDAFVGTSSVVRTGHPTPIVPS